MAYRISCNNHTTLPAKLFDIFSDEGHYLSETRWSVNQQSLRQGLYITL